MDMTDQPDPQRLREVERGHQAQLVLDSPVYRQAFDSMRQQLLDQWECSPARDTEGREKLWLAVGLLGKVQAHLQEAMQTGQMASMQLEQQRSRWQALKEAAARRWA